jgi:predicted MFS family arabinose efflux permease
VGGLAALALLMRSGPLAAILAAAIVLGAGFVLSSGFMGRRVIAAAGDERELASAGINSVRLVGNAAGACLAGIVANLMGWSVGATAAAAAAASFWLFVFAVPVAAIGAAGAWRVGALKADRV